MLAKVTQFLQIAERQGLDEALDRTDRYVRPLVRRSVLRKFLIPLIGARPELYRAFTSRHPGFTDADPYKIMFVDPDRISHTSERDGEQLYGRVVGGTWDSPKERLSELDQYRGVREYAEEGDPTTYLDVFEVIRHTAGWSYGDSDGGLDRLEDIDTLVDSLLEDGYLLQSEVDAYEKNGFYGAERPENVNEITVSIGRDGTLYYCWMGGSHRLFLSQILDVDFERVPVQVAVRHARWQRVRDVIRRSETVEDVPPQFRDYLAHPDVRDVHPASSSSPRR